MSLLDTILSSAAVFIVGKKKSNIFDGDTTSIQFSKYGWKLPVLSLVINHGADHVKNGTVEVWVYVYAAYYAYRKVGHEEAGRILLRSSHIQGELMRRRYMYDTAYHCGDGSVVLLKKIPLRKLAQELIFFWSIYDSVCRTCAQQVDKS